MGLDQCIGAHFSVERDHLCEFVQPPAGDAHLQPRQEHDQVTRQKDMYHHDLFP